MKSSKSAIYDHCLAHHPYGYVGFWAFEIAQKYPESKVVAMDISLPTDSAQVNNGQPITPNVSFVFGDILNTPLPFADGTFDLVYQREVGAIVPIPYWKPLFEDFARILKPNGSVHLVEYGKLSPCQPLSSTSTHSIITTLQIFACQTVGH